MIRQLRPCFFGLVLITLLPTVLCAGEFVTEPPPIWRDASPSDAESELDRVSRAYVRLANEARPAIVQIRVAAPSEAQTGVKNQPQGSTRAPDSSSTRTGTFSPRNTSSTKQRKSRFALPICSGFRRS